MRIDEKERITHPAQVVFFTLRDKTPALVPKMPNVESVTVLDREEAPPLTHLRNRWQGTNSDVPKVLRPFVSKDLLSWYDRATWDEESLQCTWKLEAVVGKDCFSCEGNTRITSADDQSCTFIISAELIVNPEHLPGVPRFLARKLRDPLERFIGNAIRPNLTSIAGAVQRYLDEKGER